MKVFFVVALFVAAAAAAGERKSIHPSCDIVIHIMCCMWCNYKVKQRYSRLRIEKVKARF